MQRLFRGQAIGRSAPLPPRLSHEVRQLGDDDLLHGKADGGGGTGHGEQDLAAEEAAGGPAENGGGADFLKAEFDARSALLVADDRGKLHAPMSGDDAPEVDQAIASWSFEKAQAAGHGTDTLPASPTLYLPLSAPMRVRGVLAVQLRDATRLAVPEQRRLLDTCASLLAISLERIHYVDVAQGTTVQMESDESVDA